MARVPISLRRKRRLRQDLVRFLDLLGLYLQAGYDIGFAWPEVWRSLHSEFGADAARALEPAFGEASEGPRAALVRLGDDYPDPAHRLWFSALAELYAEGAGMRQGVMAVTASLRGEQRRDLDRHCRELPTRVNVLLLLFFFPAVAALLFVPLLAEILSVFGG